MLELLTDDARARLRGDGTLASIPQAARAGFARRLDALIERHRELWMARNRPGGRIDSVAWLEHLRAAYETGHADPTWGGWPQRFT